MSRLVYLVTDPITAHSFLRGHLATLAGQGFDVHLVAAPGSALRAMQEVATTHAVPMQREIHPLADLATLGSLRALLARLAPQLVNASTPKAGLLGLLAARRAGVRHRIYLVRGLRLETTRGLKRRVLAAAERRAARAATRIVCVSESLRQRYADLGLARHEDITVLGSGSSNGVSLERFAAARMASTRESVRRELGLAPDAPVVGFVGRLTRDKGVADLVDAFLGLVQPVRPEARLVFFGDFESGDPVDAATHRRIQATSSILIRPFTPGLAKEYAAFDIVAFPSYREGFPNVPLEAAASALPVVGYRATGTVDAVVDGATGTLVEVGDRRALGQALLKYLDDPQLGRLHGAAGLERAGRDFRPQAIWQAWSNTYRKLLETD